MGCSYMSLPLIPAPATQVAKFKVTAHSCICYKFDILSSSNRKYPHFPLFSYFSVVVCLRCLLHHILSLIVYTFRENREFVFNSIVQFMMSANSWIRFGFQIVLVCLYVTPSHYHHCANFIWKHWTYKMPVRYNLSSVWVRLSIFPQLSIIQYVGLCVFSLPISFVMIEIIYTLSYYHHQIGSMNYYPLFRVRSWNNGMRCMSFYIHMNLYPLFRIGTWSNSILTLLAILSSNR